MSEIPDEWLPNVAMKRVLCHWTAGAYTPSNLDKEHYHLLIDGDGQVHRGKWSIAQNHHAAHGGYAAHTYGLNGDSIGVSVCCMGGAKGKSNLGRYPMKKVQWETLAKVVAQLCARYDFEPTERQVLQHGDVHRVYGIDQWGKWDVNFLPWDPKLPHDEVGHEFRRLVRHYMEASEHSRDAVKILVNGAEVGLGTVTDGVTMAPVRAVAQAFGAKIAWNPQSRTVNMIRD